MTKQRGIMILFINACVREDSRTERLARKLFERLGAVGSGSELPGNAGSESSETMEEVRLADIHFPVADAAFLAERDRLLAGGAYADPLFGLARQFAATDTVVIAAPFWDLSFPAALKQYLEQVNVTGITFRYSPEGIPQGLCRARKLWYVSTAGGPVFTDEYDYGYVCALAKGYYGIPETALIRATGLDIDGTDVEAILRGAEEEIVRLTEGN